MLYYLLFFLLYNTKINGHEHVCSVPELPKNQLVTGVHIDELPSNSRVKRSADDKFRIHFEYLPRFLKDPDAELLKTQFIEPAANILRGAVKPKIPVKGILRVDRSCVQGKLILTNEGKIACEEGCYHTTRCIVDVPEKYLKKCRLRASNGTYYEEGTEGKGVTNTDLVVLVDRKYCKGDTLAWASSCFLEDILDRPILGTMNVCLYAMKPNINIEQSIQTIVHEIIHILGFSSNRYAFFRDRAGNPLVPRNKFNLPALGLIESAYIFNDKIAKIVTRTRSSRQGTYTKSTYAFTLPTVVKEAQDFFNCPSMTEVDLEHSETSGRAMSHFDEYVLHDEIMSPVVFKLENLTRITLAFLYDTGWYDVNYCATKPMRYGYKAGCTLPLEGCYKYMQEQRAKGQSIYPFCDKKYNTGKGLFFCSPDYKYIEFCRLQNTTNPRYDYIDSYITGFSESVEYCPIYYSIPCETKKIKTEYFTHPFYYGIDSRCSANNIQPISRQYFGPICLKTTCNTNTYSISTTYGDLTCADSKNVTVNSATFNCIPQTTMCPRTNGTICEIYNGTETNSKINNILITTRTTRRTKRISNKFVNFQSKFMSTESASNNIQISLFYVLFYFMVLICLLP